MSRIGKIARLSQYMREQLNQRIEDGEPGKSLVEWLNSCRAVQVSLAEYFGGRPISAQNLSEWKQGGFKDWQRNQESRALARDFLAEAEELEEEIGDTPLTDRLTETVALALARLLREAVNGEKGPQQRAAIIEIARELARLRKGDHQMEKCRLEQEVWDEEKEAKRKAEVKEMQDNLQHHKTHSKIVGDILRQEYCEGVEAGTLDPERAAGLRELFAMQRDWLRECGVKELPPVPPAESK